MTKTVLFFLALLALSPPSMATVTNTATQTVTAYGDGVTTNYTISFAFQANSQLLVYLVETSPSVSTTPITYGSGAGKYTLSGGDPATTVIMGTAPTATQYVKIVRSIPLTQTVGYASTSVFPASQHERQMDRVAMALQQVNAAAGTLAGVPTGGTAGQVLSKVNGVDYNTQWATVNYPVDTVVTKTTNYTALTTDRTILVDATSGAVTITLPSAALNPGLKYAIKKIDVTQNQAIVAGFGGAETIEGLVSFPIQDAGECAVIESDGSGWRKL